MDDFISRKWLVECVEEGWIKFDTEKDTNTYTHLVRDIAPSVQSEQRWIPFSERIPWEGQQILVCAPDGVIWMTVFRSLIGFCGAWMPLPEPYKGEP